MPTVELTDPSMLAAPGGVVEFVSHILQASTAYSIIGTDLCGYIFLWNEGAHRLYGYGSEVRTLLRVMLEAGEAL